jgi:hypothetical protein
VQSATKICASCCPITRERKERKETRRHEVNAGGEEVYDFLEQTFYWMQQNTHFLDVRKL